MRKDRQILVQASDFRRCMTAELTIRTKQHAPGRQQADMFCAGAGDFFKLNMRSLVNRWKQLENPQALEFAKRDHIQFAVLDTGLRCYQEMGAGVAAVREREERRRPPVHFRLPRWRRLARVALLQQRKGRR